ncbi:hypothetical protein KP509_19G018600 [Ceratopteris richardii]|uniref:Uncharacterized protein n=1 Tax=Ceratopteris richardii TaxID=49495 RepID=A0A8T2SII3_CERRI|nr:hypothetical protein KP509_19G018600 [Ceratopteris richardii]
MTMGSLKQMLSLVSPIEFQALQDICEYNDITEGQLICAPETITSIEMFMQGIPQICCLSFFQHLVSLSLIQQSIPYIEGLHNCPCLEILRLNENLIKRLDGLESCTRLRELYLHSNKIEHIKNISHLTDLEVLWLANNSIHEIGGLEHCVHLKELNVAQNPIKQVGEISKLKSLERLNAAATNIGSFKETFQACESSWFGTIKSIWLDYLHERLPSCQSYAFFGISDFQITNGEQAQFLCSTTIRHMSSFVCRAYSFWMQSV